MGLRRGRAGAGRATERVSGIGKPASRTALCGRREAAERLLAIGAARVGRARTRCTGLCETNTPIGERPRLWPENRKGADWFDPINASLSALVTRVRLAAGPASPG